MTTPFSPPTVGISEGMVHRVCINEQWWSYISGKISELTYRDVWVGTDDEVTVAIAEVNKLLNVGLPVSDCG